MSLRRNSSAFSSYVALTKPRITLFVVMTAFVGFVAGTKGPLSGMDLGLLFHTLLGTALVAGALSVVGLIELLLFTNGITTALAAFTLVSYVCVYTPMKTRSPASTIVGAIPGALPPLGGYAAAAGALGLPGLALFAI